MFDPKRHYVRMQGGRQYLPVAARIAWMREENPLWSIVTDAVTVDFEKQFAVFRATISNEAGNIIATATGSESVRDFGDWLEKAETKAVGRALAYAGFGTLDALELAELPRFVDSPQPAVGLGQRPDEAGPPYPNVMATRMVGTRVSRPYPHIATAPANPAPANPAPDREALTRAKAEWRDICGEAGIDEPHARGELLNVILGRPRESRDAVSVDSYMTACELLETEGIPAGFFDGVGATENESGEEKSALFGPDEGVAAVAATTNAIAGGL